MKFLLDVSQNKQADFPMDYVAGQLMTPLTNYARWGERYAIDNGAFSGFPSQEFKRLLNRNDPNGCLFVCCPDVVGSARRTLELFDFRTNWIGDNWPVALVAQNGLEDMPIPWSEIAAIFIGGCDPWKDSKCSIDIAKTARTLGKHVHVGRVNTHARYQLWKDYADTCDGSGVCRFRHMIKRIVHGNESPRLFQEQA